VTLRGARDTLGVRREHHHLGVHADQAMAGDVLGEVTGHGVCEAPAISGSPGTRTFPLGIRAGAGFVRVAVRAVRPYRASAAHPDQSR
jgi:hypothetical protein